MTQALASDSRLSLIRSDSQTGPEHINISAFADVLGITGVSTGLWADKLPFSPSDVTAGTENELQVAVTGKREDVDLARAIETSNYFKNIAKRVASGDAPQKIMSSLEDFLSSSNDVWENSWVRLPLDTLNEYAKTVLEEDLRADKSCSDGPRRRDSRRFFFRQESTEFLRIPISYLLKLSLAHAIGMPGLTSRIRRTGKEMMDHFLNDNSSPETHALFTTGCEKHNGLGKAVVNEMQLRYLLTQLLVQYANRRLKLEDHGQRAVVYFSSHPPFRQKQLNDLISDAFYRELFMSPCLNGWQIGEEKHRYMILCHEVLSRSQLNTLAKLKEADVIANNLVVLPRTSNICLANNGTHLSLGSRKLSRLMSDETSGFGGKEEKYFGDLVIKIGEHFLPLFVGSYTAAPYRFDFRDFHPERMLGFLPHELDYTHLRMIWRRWKQKADIKFFGRAMTPFGPEWVDRTVSRVLGLRGDLVLDFRLIDYLVSLLSTDESPALDGRPGNDMRLKADLSDMGIFDRRMPLYMLLRLRQYETMGFTGFEGRHYSLFQGFDADMRPAVDMQLLITLLAYKYILRGELTHGDIPDSPTVESERRQFIFGAAIGIPTLYFHTKSRNRLMHRILQHCQDTRLSRRYRGYQRVPTIEYQRALIRLLRKDGNDLIEMLGLGPTLDDLEQRINAPKDHSAAHRIVKFIAGDKKGSAMKQNGREFNQTAESYYRNRLRKEHMKEAYDVFRQALLDLDSWQSWRSGTYNQDLLWVLNGKNADDFLTSNRRHMLSESLAPDTCRKLIFLLLLVLYHQQRKNIRS